ncbi:MAG: hypothetical protein RL254_629 [Planctomycetota bacterium]
MADRSIPNTRNVQRVSTRRFQYLAAISLIPWICCVACVMYRPVVTRPPTLGDELISLDQAKKDGLITQEEFDKRRAETIAVWKAIGDAPIISVPIPSEPAAGEVSK